MHEQSRRDVVLGGLLALDELLRDSSAAEHDQVGTARRLRAVAHVLALDGSKALRSSRRAGGVGLAYGLPAWLLELGDDVRGGRGLGRLLTLYACEDDLQGPEFLPMVNALRAVQASGPDLLELQRLSQATAGSPLPYAPVGAAGLAAGTGSGTSPTVRFDPAPADWLEYDDWLRGQRVDFPTVADRGHGVLLGLQLEASAGTDGAVESPDWSEQILRTENLDWPDPWKPCKRGFRDGVRKGHRAAVDLLRDCGVGDEDLGSWRGLRFGVLGLLPPAHVTEGSAALPVALRVLAEVSGLPQPQDLLVVATGALAADGASFEPLTADFQRAKVAAVAADGRASRLLAPTADGWQLLATEPGAPVAVDRPAGSLGLAGAAALLWGDRWADWVGQRRLHFLDRRHWQRRDLSRSAVVSAIPVVSPTQVNDLVQHFTSYTRPVAVLGGPANSGKTVIASCLATRLRANGWEVLGLETTALELPDRDELIEVVRQGFAAFGSVGGAANRPRLVVLDGLQAIGNANLGRAVEAVRDALHVSVLAVARYDLYSTADWNTETVRTVPAVVGRSMLNEFVSEAARQHSLLRKATAARGLLVRAAAGDLWLLTELMQWAGNGHDFTRLRDDFVAQRLAGLQQKQREQLTFLATVSLLQSSLPLSSLPALPPEVLASFGAKTVAGRVSLSSPVLCRLLLGMIDEDDSGISQPSAWLPLIATHLKALVAHVGERADQQQVAQLLRGSSRIGNMELRWLSRSVADQLPEWASRAEPDLVATVIRLVADHIQPKQLRSLVRRMCAQLPVATLDPHTLDTCVRTIVRERHLLDDDPDDSAGALTGVVEWLRNGGLAGVLSRPASPRHRLSLLRCIGRLHQQDLSALALAEIPAALRGLRETESEDYLVVRSAQDLVARLLGELDEEVAAPQLADLPDVRRLLEARPEEARGLALFINRLVLRLAFGDGEQDWDVLLGVVRRALFHRMEDSPLGETARAFLTLARFNRGFCVRLLNIPELRGSLHHGIRTASAVEVAALLRTITRLHGRLAHDLLHTRSEPRADLADIFVAGLRGDTGDGKGAGMLLSAAAAIDELYESALDGFANLLAEKLGEDFAEKLIRLDLRPSVVFHFLGGLSDSNASYRLKVERRAANQIAKSVRGSDRAWGARLALLLGADDSLGEHFLTQLADLLSVDVLLDRMTAARRSDALTIHHRLGRVLYPAIPDRFVRRFFGEGGAQHFADTVAGAKSVNIVRACDALSLTLAAGAITAPGREALAAADRDWLEQLLTCYHAGDLAESLRLLAAMDPDEAARVTQGLLEPPKTSWRGATSHIETMVRRSLSAPATALELLTVTERILPGEGRRLLFDLEESPGSWRAFTAEVGHEQDPRQQAVMLRRLGNLDPAVVEQSWLAKVQVRWMTALPWMRSPAAIAELIRTFLELKRDWALDTARRVDFPRLEARLAQGGAADLRSCGDLLSALTLAGQRRAAAELVDVLETLGVERLAAVTGLADGARLLGAVHAVRPKFGALLATEFGKVLDAALRQTRLADEATHWISIGWLAKAVAEAGSAKALPRREPARRPPTFSPAAVCWAMTWLPDQPWTRAARREALDTAVEQDPPRQSWAAAAVLTAAAKDGRAAEMITEPEQWLQVAGAPWGHLLALYRVGAGDPTVGGLLDTLREPILAGLRAPAARADLDAATVRGVLYRS